MVQGRQPTAECGSWRRGIGRAAALILAWLASADFAAAQTPGSAKPELPAPSSHADRLRGGWYPWDPYQYRDYRRGVPILTGFDVEIERALARILGVEILLPEVAWDEHLAALAAGTADIAAGATANEARRAYTYFSKPYRSETDLLILPSGAAGRYPFRTIDGMLETIASQKFRLGVVAGFVYADSRVNAFIADPAHKDLIVATASDAQNLRNLLAGVIDGFLADRIAAATAAWRYKQGARVEEHPLRFSTDIHFMLSRATQTPQTLARLDAAIDELRRSGELRRLASAYALPVLINQTLDSEWFRVLAFIGIAAFALSGVVLAYAGQYSLFAALILATLPALGGGVLRDLLLQRDPLGRAQSRGAADRVRHCPGRDGGDQGHVTRSRRAVRQMPAIARPSRVSIDRSLRCHRACLLHGRRRGGRARHVGSAALAVGSDRSRPHRLVRRPDARHVPPRPRGRQPERRTLSRDRRRLGAGLCHLPRMGGRTTAAG